MPGASMLFFFVFVLSACVALAVALMAWRRGVRPLALEPRARDLVFDSLDEAVLVLDLQTRIVDINPAALSMLGLSTPPIGQLALLVLSAWQEQLSPYRSWPKAELELTFTMPDQTLHYFEVRIFPMRDRRGQLSGRVVMARDVTDRHAAELRMRQLERVVEQSPASVVITDTSGRIEYVNPTFTRLTGYRLDEALGQNPNILKTGHTSPEEYAQMWQIISSGHEWRGEFLNRKKNGDLYWEEAHIAPVLDTTGRLTHYVAVKEDITVRKRIEEDLRASRARLKAIFDNASAGITLVDQTGHFIQVNQRWVEMIGYSAEELYQLTPPELTYPDDRAAEEELRWAVLDGRLDSYAREKRYICKDGRIFWGALSVTSIRNAAGKVEASLGVVSDITAHKQSESAARQRLQELEALRATMTEVLGELDLDKLLLALVERMVALLDSTEGELALYDPTTRTLKTVVSYRQKRDFTGLVLAEGEGALGRVAQTRRPLIIDDYHAWDERLPDYPFPESRLQLLLAPLLSGSELLGVISVGVFEALHQYAAEDVRLIEMFAQQAAIAIHNARLFEHTRRHAERLRLLTQVSMNINQSPDLEQVLNSAMEGLLRVLNFDQISIGLLDEARQNLRLWAHHHIPANPPRVGLVIPVVADSSLQRLLDTKAPLAIEDAPRDPLLDHVREVIAQQRVQSILLVPLVVHGEMIGSIGCDVLETPRRFTPEEIELSQTVANLLAVRIEQTRLLEDERRLRQQTQRRAAELRGVIDATRDGIFMMSMESQVSVINTPALRLLNLPGQPIDWRGKSVRELISALRRTAPPAARIALSELRRMDDGNGPPNEGDVEILTCSVHWQNLPVHADTKLLGWLFVLRDLTEERAIAQMREDMTRTMVHDLRNPLTSILGALDMLLDGTMGELEPYQIQTVSIARRSTERMLRLVNLILDVSRLESGHMPLALIPLRLNDLVQDSFQFQMTLAQSKQVELIDGLPANLPLVTADFHLIQRVLQNLIGNAIKFAPHGGRVAVGAAVTSEQTVQVSVRDTGPGIPPEIRDQLFQKFVTGQQKDRGSGLGLAFCKLAMEAHGQRIWIDSTSDQGTTFIFTLPIHA